jgi:hypothetical protein
MLGSADQNHYRVSRLFPFRSMNEFFSGKTPSFEFSKITNLLDTLIVLGHIQSVNRDNAADTMVQGNILTLGLTHVLIASQTGIIAGTVAYVAILFAKTGKQWIISVILGLATGITDYFVHPGMFGTAATEAVVTGLGAAALSYLIGMAIRRFRAKSAQESDSV